MAGPPLAVIQGEQSGSSLYPVFVIPCQSFIINIILEWATAALTRRVCYSKVARGTKHGGPGDCELRQAWEFRVSGREAEIRARVFHACAWGFRGLTYHPLLSRSVGISASEMSSIEVEFMPSSSTSPRSLQRIHKK